MTEFSDFPAPAVTARASFHGHDARRKRGKEGQDLLAPQLLSKDHSAVLVGSMCLEYGLRQIKSNCANIFHGRLLFE
jgi:hypothetical protein